MTEPCYDAWPVPAVRALRAASPVTRHLPDAVTEHGVLGSFMRRGDDDQAVAHESLAVHRAPYAAHRGAEALLRQMQALDGADTERVAPALPGLPGTPTRVVWGTDDPPLSVEYGERLGRDLGTTLARVEGGEHFTPEDHPTMLPDATNALVHEARVSRGAPAPGSGNDGRVSAGRAARGARH